MYNNKLQHRSLSVWQGVLLLLISFFFTGCATTDVTGRGASSQETGVAAEDHNNDPLETVNRKMYVFNDKLDTYVAKPISDAYLWATPKVVQTGISNFFSNLKDVNVILNDFLQGKFQQGLEDTGRFTVNSTVGLFGLFDVATEAGLPKHEEDFGQTLATWGVPEGPYLVLPVLGPTTTRDIPGSVFDTAANPVTYVGLPVQLISLLNTRANAEGALRFIDDASLDPYVFTRESFLQYRRNLAFDGLYDSTEEFFDIEDELYDDSIENNKGESHPKVNEVLQPQAPSVAGADFEKSDTTIPTALEQKN